MGPQVKWIIILCLPFLVANGRLNQRLDLERRDDLKRHQSQSQTFSWQIEGQWEAQDNTKPRFYLLSRLWVDRERKETYKQLSHQNIEKLIAYGELPLSRTRLGMGLREFTWGENLSLPILDVVNPRSLKHPSGYFDAAAKMPEALLYLEHQYQDLGTELIVVPQPRSMEEPEAIGGLRIAQPPKAQLGRDSHYGMRLSLMNHGFDHKLYYFRHGPRLPAYEFQAFATATDIKAAAFKAETYGVSTSYAGYNWLFRGDLAHHSHVAATTIVPKTALSGLSQSIMSLSWFSAAQHSLGLEWHSDYWHRPPVTLVGEAFVSETTREQWLNWLALNGSLNLGQDWIQPTIFFLRGIEKADQLIRIALPVNVSDHFSFNIEYQKTAALSHSPKVLLGQHESLAARLSVAF